MQANDLRGIYNVHDDNDDGDDDYYEDNDDDIMRE